MPLVAFDFLYYAPFVNGLELSDLRIILIMEDDRESYNLFLSLDVSFLFGPEYLCLKLKIESNGMSNGMLNISS